MKLILAIDPNGGIGMNDKLSWNCAEELRLFRKKTLGHSIIMGRRTFNDIPALDQRTVLIISDVDDFVKNNRSIEKKDIWIAGGKYIYEQFLKKYPHLISEIHLSLMKVIYPADTFLNWELFDSWSVTDYTEYKEFHNYTLCYSKNDERQYLELLSDVLDSKQRKTRNSVTRSLFCRHLCFDMDNGFPLLTTKKMFWKGIVAEFLFFINGYTDTKWLEERNCFIWKANTSRHFLDNIGLRDLPEGQLGPMYGYQWRYFNAPWSNKTGKGNDTGIDQLANILTEIQNNPTSRRLIMTTFNPAQVDMGVLYPCHSIVTQFYVEEGKLSMFCFNRSSDLFLGLPFNIASSALLLHLCSKLCNLRPGRMYLSLGDCHIYDQHISSVIEQLSKFRIPWKLPTLNIHNLESIHSLSTLSIQDFELKSYRCFSSIKAEMVA